MDDLAPAPTQRTSDDGGRNTRESFTARKKAVKKVQVAPAKSQDPEPEPTPEPERDHLLDVLA